MAKFKKHDKAVFTQNYRDQAKQHDKVMVMNSRGVLEEVVDVMKADGTRINGVPARYLGK